MRSIHGTVKPLRSAIAFVLMLWCAGAGCLIVTSAHGAAMAVEPAPSQSPKHSLKDASASMGEHACCKARRAGTQQMATRAESFSADEQVSLPDSHSSSGANSCCPLTSGSLVISSRTNVGDDGHVAAAPNDSRLTSAQITHPAPQALPLRLPNQDQTYLRDCVFLI